MIPEALDYVINEQGDVIVCEPGDTPNGPPKQVLAGMHFTGDFANIADALKVATISAAMNLLMAALTDPERARRPPSEVEVIEKPKLVGLDGRRLN
jgi:hypothetical protein